MQNKKKRIFTGNRAKTLCPKTKYVKVRKSAAPQYAISKKWKPIYVGEAQLNARFLEVKKSMSELRNVLGEF